MTKLRWLLSFNALKRSTLNLVLSILGGLYLLFLLGMIGVAMIFAAPDVTAELRGLAQTSIGALFVVAWAIFPALQAGVSPFMNVENFAVYGIPRRKFMLAMFGSTFLSPGSLFSLLGLLEISLAWFDHLLVAAGTLVAAVIVSLLNVAVMLVVTTAIAPLMSRRGIRETIQLVLLVPLILAGVLVSMVASAVETHLPTFLGALEVIAYTPLGVLGAPTAFVTGNWTPAIVSTLTALVLIAMLMWLYDRILTGQLARGVKSNGPAKAVNAGMMARAETTREAIRARALTYWRKDPRYLMSVIMLLPAAIAMFFAFGRGDGGLIAVPMIIGILLATSISADISYDGSAFAQHVVSGVRGRDDITARSQAFLRWATPVMTLAAVICAFFTSDTLTFAPGIFGATLGGLCVTAGLASIVSARYIIPVASISNPLSSPPGGSSRNMLVMGLYLVVVAIIASPIIVLAIVTSLTAAPLWSWVTFAVGLIEGVAVLLIGRHLGAKWYDSAQPETYQATARFAMEN